MKKEITILVPTDFSTASRAGIRFAMQWARQQRANVVITHVLNIMRLTGWSDRQFESYAAAQRTLTTRRLRRLTGEFLHRTQPAERNCSSRLLEGVGVDVALNSFSRQHGEIDLVCMGTRGAGHLRKLFGTNTGNVILHSDLPVVAVPSRYRTRPITRILYATDFVDYSTELEKVLAISRSLGASLTVLHLSILGEPRLDPALIMKLWEKEYGCKIDLVYQTEDPTLSLAGNLQLAIDRIKPSMVVMFTDRQRTFFQRVFYPSQAESLSFRSEVPLLVFARP